MLRSALMLLATVVFAAGQNQTKQGTPSGPPMSMGVLAIASDHEGTLFVDGERKIAILPGKIATVRLTAGQHFVDLRDSKGSKLWERIVNVPAGAQVAERIEFSKPIRSSPDFTMTTADGKRVSLADYRGKVVALEFILVHCPHCITTSIFMKKLYEEVGTSGFQALAVSVDANASEVVPEFVSRNAISYPVGIASIPAGLTYLSLPPNLVPMVPQLVILDRKGDICAQYGGDSPAVKDLEVYLSKPLRQLISAGLCSSLLPGTFPGLNPSAPASNPSSASLAQEIEQAERSGRTTPLPSGSPCTPDSSLIRGMARYEVKNSTAYDLRVILSGPTEQEIRVAPSSSRSVTFPAGLYKVLGRVASPNILPFYGQESFPDGTGCASEFYIDQKF